MKTIKIVITGHRPNKLGNDYDLKSELILKIKERILQIIFDDETGLFIRGDLRFITGVALGIDTLFALIAIECNIPFLAAIPCWGQDVQWPNRSRSRYAEIMNNPLCTQKFVRDGYYTPDCMQQRNEFMVNECDILIAVWDGSPGGTANCVKYAQEQKKKIFYINPKEL